MTHSPRPLRLHKKLVAICGLLLALAAPRGFAQYTALVDGVGAVGITVSDIDRAVEYLEDYKQRSESNET